MDETFRVREWDDEEDTAANDSGWWDEPLSQSGPQWPVSATRPDEEPTPESLVGYEAAKASGRTQPLGLADMLAGGVTRPDEEPTPEALLAYRRAKEDDGLLFARRGEAAGTDLAKAWDEGLKVGAVKPSTATKALWEAAKLVPADDDGGNFLRGLAILAQRAPSIVADYIPETVGRALRGGKRTVEQKTWLDRWIEENRLEGEKASKLRPGEKDKTWFTMPFTGQKVTLGDADAAAKSIAYSIANMIATIGAGAIGALGGPVVGIASGFAAGTTFSSQATKDEFLEQLQRAWLQMKGNPKAITPEMEREWQEILKDVAEDAEWYGFWEAFPETVGNLLTIGIAKAGTGTAEKVLTKATLARLKDEIAKKVGLQVATRLGVPVAKAAAMLTEEALTETWTEYEQGKIEYERGLRDSAPTFSEAIEDVLPQVLINTAVMGPIASGVARIGSRRGESESVPGAAQVVGANDEEGRRSEAIRRIVDDMVRRVDQGILSAEDISAVAHHIPEGTQARRAAEFAARRAAEIEEAARGGYVRPDDGEERRVGDFLAERFGKRPGEVVVQASAPHPQRLAVQKVGQAFGRRVLFFRGQGHSDAVNGFYHPETDTIWINERAQDPYLEVFGHETVHSMRRQHRDLYDRLIAAVSEEDEGFSRWLNDLNNARVRAGLRMLAPREALTREEYLADYVGGRFSDPSFWRTLAQKDIETTRSLAKIVVDLIRKIREYFAGKRSVPQDRFAQLDAIQDAVADTFAEMARRERATEKPAAGTPQAAGQPVAPAASTTTAAAKPTATQAPAVKTNDFERAMADRKAREERARNYLAQHQSENAKAPIILRREGTTDEAPKGVIISKSTKQPGAWQATFWDEKGFSGDTQYRSAEEAIIDLFHEGYNTEAKELFDRVSRSDAFVEGAERTEQFRREEAGRARGRADEQKAEPTEAAPATGEGRRQPEPKPSDEQARRAEAQPAEEPARKQPVGRKMRKRRHKEATTLRGRIRQMGGINFMHYRGELKAMPTAVKFLAKKSGEKLDVAEMILRDEGWLLEDENLLDVLAVPGALRRSKNPELLGADKQERHLTDQERRLREELAYEPEEPPAGDYVRLSAEDLPEGRRFVVVDRRAPEGWDFYQVVDKDPFGVVLKDGTEITVAPGQELLVRREDVEGKTPESNPAAPKYAGVERFVADEAAAVAEAEDVLASVRRPEKDLVPAENRGSALAKSGLWDPARRKQIEDALLEDALESQDFIDLLTQGSPPDALIDAEAVHDYIAEAFPEWADRIADVYEGIGGRPEREDLDSDAAFRAAVNEYDDLKSWAARAYKIAASEIARNANLRYRKHALNLIDRAIELEREYRKLPGDLEAQIKALHGSRHKFARFNADHIGSGEGSQVFGWGLYFTDGIPVAECYARLGREGKPARWSFGEDWYATGVSSDARSAMSILHTDLYWHYRSGEWKTREDAIRYYRELKESLEDSGKAELSEETIGSQIRLGEAKIALDYLEKHPDLRILPPEAGSQFIYEVTIHKGKTPDQYDYLLWHERPTKAQLDKIREEAKRLPIYMLGARSGIQRIVSSIESGGMPQDAAWDEWTGGALYEAISAKLRSDREASLFLLRAGIDGIKYPSGTRIQKPKDYSEAYWNYVVFDDREIVVESARALDGMPVNLEDDQALAASVRREIGGEIPETFADTEHAILFGKHATPEQVEALRVLYKQSQLRVAEQMANDDFDAAMREATRGQFFREAYQAAEGMMDQAYRRIVRRLGVALAEPDPLMIRPEDTELVKPTAFSFKRDLFSAQSRLPLEIGNRSASSTATRPEARVAPAPPVEAESRPATAAGMPSPAPAGVPGLRALERVRMETTGSIAAAGHVVLSMDDAASLVAGIRKSAQEMVYAVAVAGDGTVLEIHRYSKGDLASVSLTPHIIVARWANTPGTKTGYVFHNHPSGETVPSDADVAMAREVEAASELAGIRAFSGVIGGSRYAAIDFLPQEARETPGQTRRSVARHIRPTVRKTKLPVKERYLVRRAVGNEPFVSPQDVIDFREEKFPGTEAIVFVNSKARPVGWMPIPDLKKPARAALEAIRAAEMVNATGVSVMLNARPRSDVQEWVRRVLALSGYRMHLLDVFEGDSSVRAHDQIGRYIPANAGVEQDPSAVELAARSLREAEARYSEMPQSEAELSLKRLNADRRFAAGIARWESLGRNDAVRLDYTPDVLRMLGVEDLPLEIDKKTIRKVLMPEAKGGKHGRIGIEQLQDLPKYLNDPIAVFQSKRGPGALLVMTEMVDADGDTVVAAVHVSKWKDRTKVNDIASVYGKDDKRFFTREIEGGRLRYIDKNRSRAWAKSAGLYLPGESDPSATTKTILTEEDLVKFVEDGRLSIKFKPVDTESPEFRRWFGNSKVVDRDGKPLVVYHGSYSGRAPTKFNLRDVAFFTPDINIARVYARGGDEAIAAVYLQLEHPLEAYGPQDILDVLPDELRDRHRGAERSYHVLQDAHLPDLYEDSDVIEALIDAGYDGLILHDDQYTNENNELEEHTSYAVFFAEQVKSATENTGDFDADNPDIRFSLRTRTPLWYSHMERVLARKLPGSGVPAELAKLVRGWANKGEIKAEELDWSGLEDWLKEQKGRVARQDVLDYLAENNVLVRDVVYGMAGPPIDGYWLVKDGAVEPYSGQSFDGFSSVVVYANNARQAFALARAYDLDRLGPHGRTLVFSDTSRFPEWLKRRISRPTRYHQYQTPGGKNYRELLLTLRVGSESVVREEDVLKQARIEAEAAGDPWDRLGPNGRERYIQHAREVLKQRAGIFLSRHFDEPNVVVHARFNERTDGDGRSMLFIEEIQSDWHQKGRRYGYGTKEDIDAGRARTGAPPNAPFKTTWPMLAMKRIVRWAAEHGFDLVGWTTGDMQADRYDLRYHVQGIKVWRRPDGKHYRVRVLYKDRPDYGYMTIGREVPEDRLEEHVGKDIAKKVMTQEPDEEREYSGLDLIIGGEGMIGFYDRILPAEVNRFFGKAAWGNAKVGVAKIQADPSAVVSYSVSPDGINLYNANGEVVAQATTEEAAKEAVERDNKKMVAVHALPITPEMRKRALEEGMPLFSMRRLSPELHGYVKALIAAEVNLGRPALSESDIDADPYDGLTDEVKARLGASRGIQRPGLLARAKIVGLDVWHSLTRHRPYLDPEADATITDILRTHQETPKNSVRRALQALQAIAGGLRPKQYEVFAMTLVMRDMIRDIDSGLLAGELPFGFTEPEARAYLYRLEALADSDPAIRAALAKRLKFQRRLTEALVKAELLPEAVLKDDRYFHHQVLEYQAIKALGGEYTGLGVGPTQDVRLRKKGWQIARVGSAKDYNTQYVEAEFEVIAQALAQLETRHTMEAIRERADIYDRLKRDAKMANYIAVVGGKKNYDRIVALRAEAREIIDESGGKPRGSGKKRLEKIAEEIRALDPTMPFRQRIAIGLGTLKKLLGINQDEALFGDEEGIDFRRLSEIAKGDDQAAIAAKSVFKAIADREKFIKERLGKDHMTPERMIPDGYTKWDPKPGGSWYRAWAVPDRIAAAVLAGEAVIGEENARKLVSVLARRPPEYWVIPEQLAKTLDGYDQKYDDHILSRASRGIMTAWKRWILINPFRVVKYNLNNLSGDLDIAFAYDPRILGYLKRSIKDLWGDYRKRTTPPDIKRDIDLANRYGVLDSGWSVQEVWDVARELSLTEHFDALAGEKPGLIQRAWGGLKNFTRYRENWLRFAAFLYFRDRLAAGEKVYGASNPKEIDAIDDKDRKAAKLARELIGDYGNITHAGQFIRRHLIPFYAWMEINAPRYVRLMRNLKHEGRDDDKRLAAVFGWKAAKLGAKAAFLMAMVNLWNHTFFPDEEDELGDEQRRQMHLILGRRKDGSIMTLRFQGALSDALSWFGAEDVAEDVRDLKRGKKSITDIAQDTALATPTKIVNAFRPDVKGLGEVIGGRSWYPDPFNPRPIRDKLEHVARNFSLDGLYRWVAGKPKRGDTVGEQMLNDLLALGFYTSNPGESAYYDVTKYARDWREKHGKETPAVDPTDKSNAMYYYKQALRYGDLKAAERYLKRYFELGGTPKTMGDSIKRAHPLSMIAHKDRAAFLASLSPEQKERLRLATRWYEETYLARKGEVLRKVRGGAAEPPAASGGVNRISLREAVGMMR